MLGSLSPRKSSYRQHHKLSNVQYNPLAHPVGNIAEFKERTVCITANTVILEHTVIHACIITLHLERSLWCHSFKDEVVITVRAVFVTLFKLGGIFSETLLAFLACKDHFTGLCQLVRLLFLVTFGAIEPFTAAGRANSYLSVEDVFTHCVGRASVKVPKKMSGGSCGRSAGTS